MRVLAESKDLRDQLGRVGGEKVRKVYDWQVTVDRMLSIYRRVITSKGCLIHSIRFNRCANPQGGDVFVSS